MAVTISISSITQNSQSVSNNTSSVTVKLVAKWTGGSWNHTGQCKGWLKIDGITYNFSDVILNSSRTTTGSQTLMTKTVNVEHNADGTKKLSVSASFSTYLDSSGTQTASAEKTLTTIPRKSTLSASNGTLGTAQTLTVTRQSDSFTHTISYSYDSIVYTTIVSKSNSTTINWTPPLELAKQNTTGTSVSLKLMIDTYSGSTKIGSNTITISCSIPNSVKPSCSITVSDATDLFDTYGAYIKTLSKFKIVVNPTLAYGSPIASYKTTVNNTTYTTKSFTTGEIKTSGKLTITSTVKDKRGRSGSASVSVDVLNYIEPVVSKLSVKRCDEDGSENDQGEYVQITMSAAVTALNDKNTSAYLLRYKKSTDSEYTEVGLNEYENVYLLEDVTYIFAADTGSSYDIELGVTDNFKTTKRATSASTAFTLMHFGADGTSVSIGKVSEESNLFDVGLPSRFNDAVCGNVMGLNKLPKIPENSDLNDYMETGCYAVYQNATAETIKNIPVQRAGRLEVSSSTGEGIRMSQWSYIRQRFIPYNSDNAVWERDLTRDGTNAWTYYPWWRSSLTPAASKKVYHAQKVLWEGEMYMTAGQTAQLSQPVSEQANGIVLVFSRYSDNTARNYHFNTFFVPKIQVSKQPGNGHTFLLTTEGTFSVMATKYLYINDGSIAGNEQNSKSGEASGITFNNAGFVLRYVYGV